MFTQMQQPAVWRVSNSGIGKEVYWIPSDLNEVNWLAEHAEDADIDLPLLKPPPPAPMKPKMSTLAGGWEAPTYVFGKKMST